MAQIHSTSEISGDFQNGSDIVNISLNNKDVDLGYFLTFGILKYVALLKPTVQWFQLFSTPTWKTRCKADLDAADHVSMDHGSPRTTTP